MVQFSEMLCDHLSQVVNWFVFITVQCCSQLAVVPVVWQNNVGELSLITIEIKTQLTSNLTVGQNLAGC